LGDRAIIELSQYTSPRNKNFLHLPIDIQETLALKLSLKRYHGWEIRIQGDNLEIYVDQIHALPESCILLHLGFHDKIFMSILAHISP